MTDAQHHVRLVVSELAMVGFQADFWRKHIHVSLSSRKVNTMEVESFLDQVFEGCSFIVEQVHDGVEVTVE